MPKGQIVAARLEPFDAEVPSGVANRNQRVWSNHNDGTHPVVDIAFESEDLSSGKRYGVALAADLCLVNTAIQLGDTAESVKNTVGVTYMKILARRDDDYMGPEDTTVLNDFRLAGCRIRRSLCHVGYRHHNIGKTTIRRYDQTRIRDMSALGTGPGIDRDRQCRRR